MITIRPVDPRSDPTRALIAALDAYQVELYPDESNHLDPIDELVKPHVRFLGAFDDETLVGIGAVKLLDDYAELKRMFVTPAARGLGVGRRLVEALETLVVEAGLDHVRLETGIHQPEAIALYRRSGYLARGPYDAYRSDPLSLFMEKTVGPDAVSLRPLASEDAPAIQRYAADERLAATSHVPHPYPSDGAKQFVARQLADRDGGARYPLVVTSSGSLVGLLGLKTLDRTAGSAEVDGWIAVPFWGRGLATSAVRLAATLAFTGLHLRALDAICLELNVASRRVLEKTGFVEIDDFLNEGRAGGRFTGQRMRRYRLSQHDWRTR